MKHTFCSGQRQNLLITFQVTDILLVSFSSRHKPYREGIVLIFNKAIKTEKLNNLLFALLKSTLRFKRTVFIKLVS